MKNLILVEKEIKIVVKNLVVEQSNSSKLQSTCNCREIVLQQKHLIYTKETILFGDIDSDVRWTMSTTGTYGLSLGFSWSQQFKWPGSHCSLSQLSSTLTEIVNQNESVSVKTYTFFKMIWTAEIEFLKEDMIVAGVIVI